MKNWDKMVIWIFSISHPNPTRYLKPWNYEPDKHIKNTHGGTLFTKEIVNQQDKVRASKWLPQQDQTVVPNEITNSKI